MTNMRKEARGPRLPNGEKRVVSIGVSMTESVAADFERLRLAGDRPMTKSAWIFQAIREKIQRDTFGAAVTGWIGHLHDLSHSLALQLDDAAAALREAGANIAFEAEARVAQQARVDGVQSVALAEEDEAHSA